MRTAKDSKRWAVVVKFGTRREARELKNALRHYISLYDLDHVRVVHLTLAACSTPSGEPRAAATIAPWAILGAALARISAAVRRGWTAAGRLLTTRNSPTTGRQRKRSCSGTGHGTGR